MSEFRIQHLIDEISGNKPKEYPDIDFDAILSMDKSTKPRDPEPPLTGDRMKAFLLKYFRFERQMHYVATEVMYADVMFYRKTKRLEYCAEIEIKISKSDFKADFKKDKHIHYKHNESFRYIQPDYFYYAFPCDLFSDDELKNLSMPNDNYGIILVNEYGHTWVYKSANKLTTKFNPKNLDALIKRMSSEIVGLWLRRENIK